MSVSSYLKQSLQYERKFAMSLDKGMERIAANSVGILSNVGDGLERASWYSSCLMDGYQNVCQELKIEDKRAGNAIAQVYKRKDVILDIFYLYIDYILKDKERSRVKARVTTYFASQILADFTAGRLTKKALAYTMAKVLADSAIVSFSVRKQVHKKGFYLITLAEYYGRVQKSAMAARKLRTIDPIYYNILYQNKIEMLYIYVDPILGDIIKRIRAIEKPTVDDIIEALGTVMR